MVIIKRVGQAQGSAPTYKEISFSDGIMPVLRRIKDMGISVEATVGVGNQRRIVVNANDLSQVLGAIEGAVCIADVHLIPYTPTSGTLYDVLARLTDAGASIDSIYLADNNRFVIRYRG